VSEDESKAAAKIGAAMMSGDLETVHEAAELEQWQLRYRALTNRHPAPTWDVARLRAECDSEARSGR
jgi:hypothetical protein